MKNGAVTGTALYREVSFEKLISSLEKKKKPAATASKRKTTTTKLRFILSGFFQKYKNENAESYDFVMRNETFNVNNTVFYSEKNLNP